MINNKRILVFTATYNEKENIKKLIIEIKDCLPEASILIIDDNSPDQTKEIIKELQKDISHLELIVREKKLGLDSTHREAYEYAIKNQYNYLITMDADLSHDPNELKKYKEQNAKEWAKILGGMNFDVIEEGEEVQDISQFEKEPE